MPFNLITRLAFGVGVSIACAPSLAAGQGASGRDSLLFDVTQLRRYSTERLAGFLTADAADINATRWASDSFHELDSIVAELVRRRPYTELVPLFARSHDQSQLSTLYGIFAAARGPFLDSTLLKYTNDSIQEGPKYFALKYFADRGDLWALDILNCHFMEYPVSSADFADVVQLFGKYHYHKAAWNLVYSINSVSGNLGEAALEALPRIFPDARAPRPHPGDTTVEFWVAYVRKYAPSTLYASPGCVQAPTDFP